MDIQGAFDTVMRNRLILRLRQQGWPLPLVKWAASFMSNRAARVRYQDITTEYAPLLCGLPQGSPASPILFLLYTEPIYKLGFQLGRFGYADDTAILRTGRTLRETAKLATADVRELISWGAANGITFDPEKTEVMHFSHKKDDTSPSVTHGGIAKVPAEAIRWLGIWLDKKLTFRTHIEKWAAKAKKAAGHLHGLCNTKHGPLPAAVRRAVKACVEPILLYGMEAWYTGTESYTAWHGTKKVRPQIQHLVDKLDPVLRRAIRAILPVWKTTPVPIYHQESGIPPVPLLLEARRIRFAARLKSLDLAHPLAQRTAPTPIVRAIKRSCQVRGGGFKTRLGRTALLLPHCPRPTLIQASDTEAVALQTKNKDESAADFLKWLEGISPDELVVYSDGSQLPGGATGYGYAVHQNSVTICEGSGRLGPAEVFDAEAAGALEGLRAAVKIPDASDNPIVVCLDNLAAATCLRGTALDSSQSAFLKFQEIAAAHGSIHVRWIPGHTDIPGNEQADSLAKAGCALPEPPDAKPTLAYTLRTAKKQSKEAFQAWWQEHMPEKYKELKLKATTGCPKELSISRAALHHLLAARSSHGDFADYHERFNHEGAHITCSCGRRKAPNHLFYCRKIAPRDRMRLTPSPAAAINQAIGKDFEKFIHMAKASSFFTRICPRH
ncbi:reverse transcriptase domain protein [Metarhizium robertsii]|uniref:Reverse transcriptase domain protein n=1 Tax=Metarhizium robertsii TaxID=568076 RepID=A0A014QPF3_9HYPO|nr:reverse transcriptase domain protein [Metarhizium robertsii]